MGGPPSLISHHFNMFVTVSCDNDYPWALQHYSRNTEKHHKVNLKAIKVEFVRAFLVQKDSLTIPLVDKN